LIKIKKAVSLEHLRGTIDRRPLPSYESLAALEALKAARSPPDQPKGYCLTVRKKIPKQLRPKEALVIKPNEQEIEVEGNFAKRSAPELGSPSGLASRPQAIIRSKGLDWLSKRLGHPVDLESFLQNDMGLGKDISRAWLFLAWFARGKWLVGSSNGAPILGRGHRRVLLENWRAEHDRHPLLRRVLAPLRFRPYGRALCEQSARSSPGGAPCYRC